MTEDVQKLVSKCFETLEKAEVLSNVLYEKLMGEKETDIILLMINSFVGEAKITLLDIQNAIKELTKETES